MNVLCGQISYVPDERCLCMKNPVAFTNLTNNLLKTKKNSENVPEFFFSTFLLKFILSLYRSDEGSIGKGCAHVLYFRIRVAVTASAPGPMWQETESERGSV